MLGLALVCISFCDFVCWVWHLCASVLVIFCVGFGTCAFQFYDFLCWFWHLCVSVFVIFCVGFGTCVYQFLCIIVCACVGVSGKVQYQFSVEGIALNISCINTSGILYNSSCLNSV